MTVQISSSDRNAVPISWDTSLVEGDVCELWAKGGEDDSGELKFKKKMVNDGTGHVAYPDGWTGSSFLEVRGENDTSDEGTIEIE